VVKPATKETVAAVEKLLLKVTGRDEVSVAEIAKELRLDTSAASRRVAEARSRGYLVNNETKKGRPANSLPSETEILPSLDKLEAAVEALHDCRPLQEPVQRSSDCKGKRFWGAVHGCADFWG